jgi:hypothetical protein
MLDFVLDEILQGQVLHMSTKHNTLHNQSLDNAFSYF